VDPDGEEDVYIIYNYTDIKEDQEMKFQERWSIDLQIGYLKSEGLTVKIIENGNAGDILNAFYDQDAMAVIVSGHGSVDGKIITTTGDLSPDMIDRSKISKNLNTVIFENCHQGGRNAESWKEALGNNVNVVGWKGTTNTFQSSIFNLGVILPFLSGQSKNLHGYLIDIVNTKKTKLGTK